MATRQFLSSAQYFHGAVQVRVEETIFTLTTEAGEDIEDAWANLLKLYEHARKNYKRYAVVVHGRPEAGKVLLGISTVAELVYTYGAENCKPIFRSGNGFLV